MGRPDVGRDDDRLLRHAAGTPEGDRLDRRAALAPETQSTRQNAGALGLRRFFRTETRCRRTDVLELPPSCRDVDDKDKEPLMTRYSWRLAAQLSPVALLLLWATMPTQGQGTPGQSRSQTQTTAPAPPRPPARSTTPAAPPHVYGTQNGEWQTYGGDLGQHALLAARPDQRGELQQARGRLALQDRRPRPAPRISTSRSTPLMVKGVMYIDGRHAPRGRRARRGDRRDAVDAQR